MTTYQPMPYAVYMTTRDGVVVIEPCTSRYFAEMYLYFIPLLAAEGDEFFSNVERAIIGLAPPEQPGAHYGAN